VTLLQAAKILGVKSDFTKQDVKEAYRSRAKKVHPDFTGDDKKFKLLKEARDLLINNKKTVIFEQGPSPRNLNLDVLENVHVSFVDACTGCIKKISYSTYTTATNSSGCPICAGRGLIFRERASAIKCNVCGSCPNPKVHSFSIRIPAGISQGEFLTFKSKGNHLDDYVGRLRVKVSIEKSNRLTRKSNDIMQTKDVRYTDLLLESSIVANTVHGDVKISIPFGSFDGDVLKVKGRGIRSKKGSGDHIVKLRLVAPGKLSSDQLHALESLRKVGL
jgi:DnaJ-class molecular chaperone